jgi:hypothetical protein
VSWTPIDALGESNDAPSRGEIEAYAGIRLGASVADVRARLDQVLTKRTLFVKLSLEPGELDAFLRDSPFQEPLSSGAISELLTADPRPDWFTPERTKQPLSGETDTAAVLVDKCATSRVVVYVVAHS